MLTLKQNDYYRLKLIERERSAQRDGKKRINREEKENNNKSDISIKENVMADII